MDFSSIQETLYHLCQCHILLCNLALQIALPFLLQDLRHNSPGSPSKSHVTLKQWALNAVAQASQPGEGTSITNTLQLSR